MKNYSMYQNEQALQALAGCYDLHVHPNPDNKPRAFDDYELLQELDHFNMGGAVIKLQYGDTIGRGYLANKYFNCKAKLYDSMVLCNALGGLNPVGVEEAAKMGVKMVWFPTRNAMFDQCFNPPDMRTKGLYILNEYGDLKPEVYEILEVVRANNMTVSTGHMSIKEILKLCREARKMNVQIIMTHPEYCRSYVPLEQQIEMAKLGVIIEKLWLMVSESFDGNEAFLQHLLAYEQKNIARADKEMMKHLPPTWQPIPMAQMADEIRQIGVENILLGTDSGEPGGDWCGVGMYKFCDVLLKHHFTIEEIQKMGRHNAMKALHL